MKIQGSSLLESLIAMVILVTVLSVSINSILLNASAEKNVLKNKAKFTLEQLELDCVTKKKYKSEYYELEGIEYEVSVSFVNRYDGIVKVESMAQFENEVLVNSLKYVNTNID